MDDRVSIIVLAYNSATTIDETLQGCYSQTHRGVEVIVADDGSTDETASIARRLAEEHPLVQSSLVSAANSGIVKNCKRGLAEASGGWVKIIAADDILLPTAIADLVSAGTRERADVVLSQFQAFGADNRVYPLPWTVRGIRGGDLPRAMLMGFGAIAPGALVRREVLERESLPSEDYVMAEDTMFYELAKRRYRFTYLERVTVRYRVHDRQVTAGESVASPALRADQAKFLAREVRTNLGPWHPFYLHTLYQSFIDRRLKRVPRLVRSALKLADPIAAFQRYVNRDLPFQRRKRA